MRPNELTTGASLQRDAILRANGRVPEAWGAGAVVIKDGKVLVITERETNESYGKYKGMLSVPMGIIRAGEKMEPHRTAEREFLEETGYAGTARQHLGDLRIPGALVSMYLLEIKDIPPRPGNDALNPQWVLAEKLLHLPDERVRPPTKAAVLLGLLWISQP